jgi:hypothetical protein
MYSPLVLSGTVHDSLIIEVYFAICDVRDHSAYIVSRVYACSDSAPDYNLLRV